MNFRRAMLAAALTALAVPQVVLAQDVPPVVDAILKAWEANNGVKPTYKAVTPTDGGAVIEALQLNGAGAPDFTVSIDRLELSDVEDQGGGIFEVGDAAYSDVKMEFGNPAAEGMSISFPSATAEDWYVKTVGNNPTAADRLRASMSVARKATVGSMTIVAGGQTVTADGFQSTWDGDPVTGAGKTEGKISNIAIPETVLAVVDQGGMLKSLGYTSLSFDIGGAGTVANDGEKFGLDMDGYFTGRDMGTMKFGLAVADVPAALIDAMSKAAPGTNPVTFLPLAGTANVGRFVFRFEDQGITAKVLPMIAAMQGLDAATFKANAGAMVQLGMAELKVPELTKQVVDAVTAYLNDPKSITLSITPAQPLGVGQFMTINPADPAAAVTMLGVSVTAND